MPLLTVFKAFIDAGWFLDVPPYTSLRSDAFSFQKCAKGLLRNWRAQFDGCAAAVPLPDNMSAFYLQMWRRI